MSTPTSGGDDRRGRGDEPEPGRGHDPERALAAAQELGQVVAGVVLDEAGEAADDLAGAEHGLDADHLRPHGPVTQDPDTAGVGGDHPADRGRVPGAEVDPEGEARVGGGARQRRQRHPGARGGLGGQRVDRQGPEPGQADDDLARQRDAPADQAGVAALGDERHPVAPGQGHDPGHLAGRAGPDDDGRRPPEPPGPVGGVPGGDVGVHEHVPVADRLPAAGHELGRRRGTHAGHARATRLSSLTADIRGERRQTALTAGTAGCGRGPRPG